MDASLKLPETLPLDRTPGAVLRLLGEEDWALEQKLSEVLAQSSSHFMATRPMNSNVHS